MHLKSNGRLAQRPSPLFLDKFSSMAGGGADDASNKVFTDDDQPLSSFRTPVAAARLVTPRAKRRFEYDITAFPSPFARAFMMTVPDDEEHDYHTKTILNWSEEQLRKALKQFEDDIGVDKDWLEDVKEVVEGEAVEKKAGWDDASTDFVQALDKAWEAARKPQRRGRSADKEVAA